jgi:hypothetical protein
MGSFDPEQSQQTQSSQQGLWGNERAAIAGRTPGDVTQLWNAGTTAYNTPSTLMPLDNLGLYAPQRNAFDQAIRQANSQFSGAAAGRGQLSPDNIGAIAGSAAQNVVPQFAPLIGENVRNATLIPEVERANRFGQLQAILQTYPGLLGGTSEGQGTREGAGLGFNFANSFLTNFGSSLGGSAAGGATSGLTKLFGGV